MSGRTGSRRAAFRAMGSTVDVVIVGGSAAHVDAARGRIDDLERCWSRFRATSDISRINLSRGEAVEVSSATIVLLDAMVAGSAATSGAFDPTLLASLVALGDGVSRSDPSRITPLSEQAAPRGDLGCLDIDRCRRIVRAPAGLCLDPGGIGKGLAAGLVAARLIASGAVGALVSIGGDIAMVGEPPREEGWLLAVGDGAQVCIRRGGVATSGTSVRSWIAEGRRVHHVLDPRTGMPTDDRRPGGVVEATVIAGTACWAEVWTKALMVDGRAVLSQLDELGLAARVVDQTGVVVVNETWAPFAVAPADPAALAS